MFYASTESCSDMLKYVQGSYGTEGSLTLPNVQLESKLKLEIDLSIAAAIPGVN